MKAIVFEKIREYAWSKGQTEHGTQVPAAWKLEPLLLFLFIHNSSVESLSGNSSFSRNRRHRYYGTSVKNPRDSHSHSISWPATHTTPRLHMDCTARQTLPSPLSPSSASRIPCFYLFTTFRGRWTTTYVDQLAGLVKATSVGRTKPERRSWEDGGWRKIYDF